MADEKQFTIPLRKEVNKVACYKRSRRAITEVKKFISKHLKVQKVKIGKHLNKKIWEKGIKNPPPKIKVKSIKEDDYARVELPEFEFEKKKVETKKGVKEKIQEKLGIETQKEKETKKEEELVKRGKVKTKNPKPQKELKKEDKKVEEKIRSEHIVTESKKTKLAKSRP